MSPGLEGVSCSAAACVVRTAAAFLLPTLKKSIPLEAKYPHDISKAD